MCTNCCGGNCNCKKWHCGCTSSMIAKILVIIGGINWGLYGIGILIQSNKQWNLVNTLLGAWPNIEALVYVIVGISALSMIFGCRCKTCKAGCETCKVDGIKMH